LRIPDQKKNFAAYGEFPGGFLTDLGHKAHRRLRIPEQKIFEP
jgi:hypothetical protein